MKERPTIEQALKDLASSVETGLSAHPDEHVLLARKRGELSAEQADALEEHLVWCRPCAELWREISGHAATPTEPADPEEKRADWESLRARMAQEDSEEPADDPSPAHQATPHRRYARAIAAVLAVALGGAGVWIATLNDRVEDARRPRANVPIVDLMARAAQREGAAAPVEIDLGRSAIVILNPHLLPASERYQVSILDSQGHTVWTVPGLVATELGNFTLELPAGSLGPGGYRFVLESAAGRDIEVFHVRVTGP